MNADDTSVVRAGQYSVQIVKWSRRAVVTMLIVISAWAPFPLGSAVGWGAPLLEIMIGITWLFWSASLIGGVDDEFANLRLIAVPGLAIILVLSWVLVQTLPIVPVSWTHPVWRMAADALHQAINGRISIDPWRTQSECLKLSSYVAVFWITFTVSRRDEVASALLNAIIATSVAYAVYGFILALLDIAQAELIYAVPIKRTFIAGPFMLHNSFATFEGLGTLASVLKVFDEGRQHIVSHRGTRRLALTSMQFAFGRGAPWLIGALLSFAAVVASASRAGFIATATGLLSMAFASMFRSRTSPARFWMAIAAGATIATLFVWLTLGGEILGGRLGQLIDAGNADDARLVLWDASTRMIADSPWRGMGLGTFQDAYPIYARQALPYVMDKAHSDYLEFAAGVGVPAAIMWWGALGYLGVQCLLGAIRRRRNRHLPLLGFGAIVLVAVHSSVDFSLQIPAVGLLFATIFGMAVAQAWSAQPRSVAGTLSH